MKKHENYPSPRSVIERYLDTLYSQHRLDLVEELIAPETWRHTPGGLTKLTLEESKARIGDFMDKFPEMHFESSVMVVEGEYVTSLWRANLTTKKNGKKLDVSGIEVFRVVEGKIVEAWNQDPAGSVGLWQDSKYEGS